MNYIFLILFLISSLGLVLGLIRPTLLIKFIKRSLTRKKILLVFGSLSIIFFVLTGIVAEPSSIKKDIGSSAVKGSNQESTQSTGQNTQEKAEEQKNPQTQAKQSETFKVTKVIDGDTIQVVIDNEKETIRLIGIDSPETVDPRKSVQCFGKEASAKAKLLLSDKSVMLESDPTQGERDKYQRLLRYVFLEDGTNFNKLMISEGYAHEYTYNIPYKYQSEFKQAQKEAEENKRGLWADNACLTNTPQPSTQTSGTVNPTTTSGFTCAEKTTCGQMSSCAEAEFYLNTCGVSRLDGDKDGVPCETLCR
ncbi:MAG: thermonuclease family protein [Candidatus Daviesbacteria bacterium]|nr:thermonuclease family protein [Candidatus Daviesbacteria bacterium]